MDDDDDYSPGDVYVYQNAQHSKEDKPPSYITHTSDPDDQDGESKR